MSTGSAHTSWKQELASALRTRAQLEQHIILTPEEKKWFDTIENGGQLPVSSPPFLLPEYYVSLFSDRSDDPLRLMSVPRAGEFTQTPEESADPLHEKDFSPVPGLIHRYEDRALFTVTGTCGMYCRHCFRRRINGAGLIDSESVERAAGYLSHHKNIRELLLSGGDPLTLSDSRLSGILTVFQNARPDLVFRVASRMPVVLPSRITDDLADLLAEFSPLWMVVQFNHPAELTRSAAAGIARLVDRGVPVLNQAVLLRGVNDNTEVLRQLFSGLTALRVKPYYLFQGDLAAGTSALRVPILKAIDLVRELGTQLSGIGMPVFALDMPGGGGKVRVLEIPYRVQDRFIEFEPAPGKVFRYPLN